MHSEIMPLTMRTIATTTSQKDITSIRLMATIIRQIAITITIITITDIAITLITTPIIVITIITITTTAITITTMAIITTTSTTVIPKDIKIMNQTTIRRKIDTTKSKSKENQRKQ